MKKKEKLIFTWKGKAYVEWPAIFDKVLKAKNKKEAKEFAEAYMSWYRSKTIHADGNIGYIIGYYGPSERKKLHALFKTRHPILGVNY